MNKKSRSWKGRWFYLWGIAILAGIPLLAEGQVGGTVEVFANGETASEDGDVGLFTVTRTGTTNSSLAVNYSISGTATNGVDYVTLSGSVTIPAGQPWWRILVRALPDAGVETNETVIVKLSANANYVIGSHDSATVTIYEHSAFDRSKRFDRGTTTDPTYHSFVIPLDSQRGIALPPLGGFATNFFPTNFWSMRFHYDATNLVSQAGTNNRIPFQNPIAAFGKRVGGSPLYIGKQYSFGIYAGTYGFTDADFPGPFVNQLSILAYYRSNFIQATNFSVRLPRYDKDTSDVWQQFATNGYSLTVSNFGLTTTISRLRGPRWGPSYDHSYVLTHSTDSTATNYIYDVRLIGYTDDGYIALNDQGLGAPARLYTIEFDQVPPWRPGFLDQPQFDGQPLPSFYLGKSLEELLAVSPTMPSLTQLFSTNYQQLNHSPELRQHPTLDRFVADMGNDPLALATYVLNEIEVTDLIDYDTNQNASAAVYLGGVNRSALATFQERQGSPLELCALTVYLLRRAGVPATYVFPTNNGMQLLDFQLSRLMGIQLRGAVTQPGLTNVPHLIPVNYPWVAAYLTNESRWVHIFPWMKDTEIVEGLNLYDYFSTNYNSGFKWYAKYLQKDTNILSLSAESDLPSALFPKFIQKSLNDNFPGLSLDDIGIKAYNRRRQITRWDDFPCPFALSGAPNPVESLKSNTNLFNTIQIRVFSNANTNKFVDSGEMMVADLHNRKLLLRSQQVGTNNVHDLILSLGPYHSGITSTGVFGAGVDPTFKLSATNQLNSTDDKLTYRVTYKRLRNLGTNFTAAFWFTNFWGYLYDQIGGQKLGQVYTKDEQPFRKGDLVAFCLDVGRVTDRMLQVHAQELWDFERTSPSIAATNRDAEVFLGTPAYLMGMSYWEGFGRFAAWNQRIHKVRPVGNFSYGFGLLRPKRDTGGQLVTNGVVVPIEADLHIPVFGELTIFNGMARPDIELDIESGWWDYRMIQAGQSSALEHGTIRSFFQTNAVSAVRLVHLAGTNALRLNANNFMNYRTTIESADAGIWRSISNWFTTGGLGAGADPALFVDTNFCQAFVTPGNVTNGSFRGVGAVLLQPFGDAGLISGGLDVADSEVLEGGTSSEFPVQTLTAENSSQSILTQNTSEADSLFSFLMQGFNQGNQALPSTGVWKRPDDWGGLFGGSLFADPALAQSGIMFGNMFGTGSSPADSFLSMYNSGAAGSSPVVYTDWQSRISDPVNVMNGEFYIDAVDLSLPGPMPLQVRRNYGSQNLADNQFGFGWKINCVPFLSVSPSNGLIFAAEMDGSLLSYRRQASPNDNLWIPTAQDNPLLNNKSSAGIGSVANLFNSRLLLTTPGGTNTYTLTSGDGSVRTFTQRPYPVGSFTRSRPYLDKWQDNRGNSYTIQYGEDATQTDYGQVRRIQSSNGGFLGFYYDAYGHIIEAYTGDGRRLYYDYDSYGDLIKVTLPDASELSYECQHSNFVTNSVTNFYSTHLITRELKPDGRVLQNDYDSLRRVTNQWATVGSDLRLVRNGRFVYSNNFDLVTGTNVLTGKTEIYDYTNRVTTYYYTNSLIRKIVDPLTQTNLQDWYETDTAGGYRRSLKSNTDKRGLTTSLFYDSSGNVVTNIVIGSDLTGDGLTSAISTFGYNSNNLPTVLVEAGGRQTKTVYGDTNYLFLPTSIETYASNGVAIATNRLVYTNAFTVVTNGSVVRTNRAFGLLARSVRAADSSDAATNDFAYDGRGFLTSTMRYTRTADPAVTNGFLYNARDEVVQQSDAAGRFTRFDYDGLGRLKAREVFEAGATVPLGWEYSYYNPNGEIVWSDGPRYNPEDYIWRDYDGAGRLCVSVRWRSQGKADGTGVEAPVGDALYATTFYDYDPLGNQIRVVDPRGVITTNTFDAIGQMLTSRLLETNGTVLATNIFAYEPGGKVKFVTNALGGVTETQYTSTGLPKYRKNPDGSTNGWRYYADGRLRREFQRNGAYWETIYDDANRLVTRSFYSSLGTPLATNVSEMDRRGNVIRSIDAAGSSFTNLYDGLDRIKLATGPAIVSILPTNAPLLPGMSATTTVQQTTTYFYDASGRIMTNLSALGEKTVTKKDALGRVTSTAIYSTTSALIRTNATVYSANHQGATNIAGSGSSAITTASFSDNDGHSVLALRFPNANSVEYTWQSYDIVGNRTQLWECSSTNSVATIWATNAWQFDGLNHMRAETSLDGASTTFGCDLAGNVTNRAMPGGLSWRARYDSAGRMLEDYDSASGGAARTNSYSYYASGSIYAGLLQTITDGRGVSCAFTYDDWLRPATNTYAGASPEQSLTTIWRHDARGLMTNVSERFATASTGPSNNVARSYDAYGELLGETLWLDGVMVSSAGQAWDSAGRRAALGFADFAYSYAWRADGTLGGVTSPRVFGGSTYLYDLAGQLTNRTVGTRATKITSRDGLGRPLAITTTVLNVTKLTESLSWRPDGLLSAHTIGRTGDFTNQQTFTYADLSRRLIEERVNINAAKRWTNSFTYDNGQSGKLGVLTKAGTTGSAQWSGGVDALSRINTETNTAIRRPANGRVNGVAVISSKLDGVPQSVASLINSNGGSWRATLELTPGVHQLQVDAVHPSGLFTATTNSWFTNNVAAETVTDSHDPVGNITNRVWKQGSTVMRSQTLLWDGRGRLWKVSERDVQTNGYNWSAFYDAFGRRIQTTTVVVTNAVTNSSSPIIIGQYYDPSVEFLEVGVNVNGITTWKLHGPDLSGSYGGMQGTGGFEAIAPPPDLFCPLLPDARGNLQGVYDPMHFGQMWFSNRVTGYGAVPGYRPPALGFGGDIHDGSAWRGRWSDVTGLTYLGARYYDPESGRFLSADPMGHGSDPSLYAFSGGDPINLFDADGRLISQAFQNAAQTLNPALRGGDSFSQTADFLRYIAANTENVYIGTSAELFSSITGDIGGRLDPAQQVQSMIQLGQATGTIYDRARGQGSGPMGAGYEAFGYGFGQITGFTPAYEGYTGYDLASATEITDDWERTTRMVNGGLQIAATGVGGAEMLNNLGLTRTTGDALTGPLRGPCFAAGTIVKTPIGNRRIEELQVGEAVIAYNFENGELVQQRIASLKRAETACWLFVDIENGESIQVTRFHPFWVESTGKWVEALDLEVGMTLRLTTGNQAKVLQVRYRILDTPEATYNFEVANSHNYFVGLAGILVHNADQPWPSPGQVFGGFELANKKGYDSAQAFQLEGAKAGRTALRNAGLWEDGFRLDTKLPKPDLTLQGNQPHIHGYDSRGRPWALNINGTIHDEKSSTGVVSERIKAALREANWGC